MRTKRVGILTMAALAVLVLAGCGANPGSTSQATLTGTVVLSPACPVATTQSRCPPRLARGVEVTVSQDGHRVTTTKTDNTGIFTVELPAGTYRVSTRIPSGAPTSTSRTVQLNSGQTTKVQLTVDSRIR